MPADAQRAAIIKAAQEDGVDPTTALAIAERESDFDPRARSSKTIRGMFQMRGDLRQQYGVGDSDDPYAQTKGWTPFFKDTKATMGKALGRDVTDAEGYAGHHFGAGRAAKMIAMDPATPVDQVFTPNERAQNPHFDKAGSVGNLLSSVTGDIDTRRGKYGAASGPLDTSGFEPLQEAGQARTSPGNNPAKAGGEFDLSGFEPVQLDTSAFEPV